MTVTLYNNKSASNVLGKSYDTVQSNITATAKGVVDVDNPVLLLNYSSLNFNYVQISEFGRFYFVTSRALEPGGHIRIMCKSDPLESFKTSIKACDGLAVRNEDKSKWDKNEPDPAMITRAKRVYRGKAFGQMQNITGNSDATYILGVM